MPPPKRVDVDDFMDKLDDDARPHLQMLRELSLGAAPDVEETLHWNSPAYLKDGGRLWMLQAFGKHCSLRFPPRQFGEHRDEVKEAGYETGAGFIKLPYDADLPVALLKQLMTYRLDDFAKTGTW